MKIGYILNQEHYVMPEFYASWQDLLETLEEISDPTNKYTIEPCGYYESDFKEKNDE